MCCIFFFQAEDGIRDLVRSRGLGDVYKRQIFTHSDPEAQPRGGPKADISETFRSTVRGCGGRAPTTHPQGRISGLPKGSPVNTGRKKGLPKDQIYALPKGSQAM